MGMNRPTATMAMHHATQIFLFPMHLPACISSTPPTVVASPPFSHIAQIPISRRHLKRQRCNIITTCEPSQIPIPNSENPKFPVSNPEPAQQRKLSTHQLFTRRTTCTSQSTIPHLANFTPREAIAGLQPQSSSRDEGRTRSALRQSRNESKLQVHHTTKFRKGIGRRNILTRPPVPNPPSENHPR